MWPKLELIVWQSFSFLAMLCASLPVAVTAQPEQCGLLIDALSFLQQHTTATAILRMPSSSMPLTWSSTPLMASLEDFKKEVEAYSVEDGMRLYRNAQRLANLSDINLEDKGFMLLQEAGEIFGNPGKAKVLDFVRDSFTQIEQSSGRSDVFGCYSSIALLPVNLVGAIFATFITVTCDDGGTCTSEGLESLRYLLVTLQHWTGHKSYCVDELQIDTLCRASLYELGANAAGLSSHLAGAVHRCPQWSGEVGREVAGMKVASIRCNLGYAKGATYLAIAISKVSKMYIGWGEDIVNKNVSLMEKRVALSAQLGATLSWIVQLVLLMTGNCKGEPGDISCAGDVVQVIAFIAQAVTSGFLANSYCFDPDNLKPAGLEQSGQPIKDQLGSGATGATKITPLQPKTTASNDNILVAPIDGIFDNANIKINEESDGPMKIVAKLVGQVGRAASKMASKVFRDEDIQDADVQDNKR